jgi:hypothetical protein
MFAIRLSRLAVTRTCLKTAFLKVMFLSMSVLLRVLIIKHAILWPFNIIIITALDRPDEKKPGTRADTECE